MKLSALKAFVATIEEGSLRGAARRLGVSQPALTKMVREMERELAAPLLSRSTTGVAATAQGKVLYDSACATQRELGRAIDRIHQLGGSMVGELNIGAVPVAVMLLMPETLRTFQRKYPQIRLRVSEELYIEQLMRLRKGEVDVAIGPLPAGLPHGEFAVESLMPVSMVVVVRRGSALARARSLADLADARWVFTGAASDAGYAKTLFAQHGLPVPQAGALVNSTLGLVSIIAAGDFVGLLPQQIAAHRIAAEYLAVVPVREGPLQSNMVAMVKSESMLLPATRHFIAHLHRAAYHLMRGA